MQLSANQNRINNLVSQKEILLENLKEGVLVTVERKKDKEKIFSLIPDSFIGTVDHIDSEHLSMNWATRGNETGFSRHTIAEWFNYFNFKEIELPKKMLKMYENICQINSK